MYKIPNKILYNLAKLLPSRMIDDLIPLLEKRVGVGGGATVHRSGEVVVFDLLNSLNQPSLTVIDVGANKGQFASEAVTRLNGGTEYLIHCFEPSQRTFELLSSNHSNNQRIVLNNCGLANSVEKATLFTDKEGSGLASLTKRELGHYEIDHGKLTEEIQLDTLDNYCSSNQISQIDLLKIDVEGHELDVLRGGQNMLSTGCVRLVLFEFGGTNIDTRTYYKDYFDFFDQLDFKLFRVLPYRKLYLLDTYRELDEKYYGTTNFVAIKQNDSLRKSCDHLII